MSVAQLLKGERAWYLPDRAYGSDSIADALGRARLFCGCAFSMIATGCAPLHQIAAFERGSRGWEISARGAEVASTLRVCCSRFWRPEIENGRGQVLALYLPLQGKGCCFHSMVSRARLPCNVSEDEQYYSHCCRQPRWPGSSAMCVAVKPVRTRCFPWLYRRLDM